MMQTKVFTIIGLMCSSLAACFPLSDNSNYFETSTPPPTIEIPTKTIEWFPPTSTYTPFPTGTVPIFSTEGPSLDYGELILADDFGDPSAWELGEYREGIIAMENSELSLAVKISEGYLSSLRKNTKLDDYYAEITVNPTICRDMDEYGVIYRVSSTEDFYRFSLTCNGQARLDRLLNGQASSPHPLTVHGSIPPGAPSLSRLGLWLKGEEMLFFVNGVNIFSVKDPGLKSGGFGIFARAYGEDEVTVNFSDLVIYNVNL